MSVPEKLAACTGAWAGPSSLQGGEMIPYTECQSTAVVALVAGGKFLRVDYTWDYKGDPQDGSLLLGVDGATAAVHWVDSWHMGDAAMDFKGQVTESGGVSVLASYPAPEGPDWGWRINLLPEDDSVLRLVMYNITPDGREHLAVEAPYRRTS